MIILIKKMEVLKTLIKKSDKKLKKMLKNFIPKLKNDM